MRFRVVLVIISFGCLCDAKRILFVPFQHVSKVMEQALAAEELTRRGHEVYMLLRHDFPKADFVIEKGLKPIRFTGDGPHYYQSKKANDVFDKNFNPMDQAMPVLNFQIKECTILLEDDDLMKKLKEM